VIPGIILMSLDTLSSDCETTADETLLISRGAFR
jgi:hypothetical protein